MRYILFGILIYLVYQFIFNLVVPLYRTTSKIRKGFDEMNDRMKEKMSPQQSEKSAPNKPSKPLGDYIDFEEIKP